MKKTLIVVGVCFVAVVLSWMIISTTNNGHIEFGEPSRSHKLAPPVSARVPEQEIVETNASVDQVVDRRTATEKDLNRLGLSMSNSFSVSAKRK